MKAKKIRAGAYSVKAAVALNSRPFEYEFFVERLSYDEGGYRWVTTSRSDNGVDLELEPSETKGDAIRAIETTCALGMHWVPQYGWCLCELSR